MDGTIDLMLIEALLILLGLSIRFISPLVYDDQPVAVDDSSKDDVILTQVVSPPSSHILVSPPTTKYDVFLNFRGEDTRRTFASYLNKALQDAGIQTFMDKKLGKGEKIWPVLLRAIEESQIYVIIFSQNYASSRWCMNELVHISECQKKFGRLVIPIFYNVDPSNIRKQNGSFGKGFEALKENFKHNQEQLKKWREALIHAADFSGWDSSCISTEVKLVQKIVKDTLRKLECKSSYHLESPVGIDSHTCEIEALIRTERIVGIWGMGGVGKTTLTRAIFQKLKDKFDACCFIENVIAQLAIIDLAELQKNCLKELLKDEDICIYDIRSTIVQRRLQQKRILLVLDDLDCPIRAKDLTEVCDWFGEGSRIIITTKDKYVLATVCSFSAYEISALNF